MRATIVTDRLLRHPIMSLSLVFVATRLVMFAAGGRFNSANLTGWMQIADIALLRDDLWRTIFYLHSQPPLFNLLIGLVLPLGGAAFPWAMGLIYAAVTLGGILCFHALARDLSGRPRLALAIAAWLCVAPAVLLFSQKLYYDGLVPWMLCMALWGLHSGLDRRDGWRLGFGFAMLAATILLRAMIHPLTFACILAIMVALAPGQRRRLLLAAALPAALIALVIAKNFLLFGVAQLSSWAPLSLDHTTVDRLPMAIREKLIAEGRLSPFARFDGFSPPETYLAMMPPLPPRGEPLLDNLKKSTGETNWHHVVYTRIGPARTRDALVALKTDPAGFAKVLAISLYHFHRPSSEFKGLEDNLAVIRGWDRVANATIGLQPAAWFGSSLDSRRPQAPLLQISWSAVLVSLGFAGALVSQLRRLAADAGHRRWPAQDLALPLVIGFVGLFVILLSSSFDVWENNRAHYDIAPVLILGALWFVGRHRLVSSQTRPVQS